MLWIVLQPNIICASKRGHCFWSARATEVFALIFFVILATSMAVQFTLSLSNFTTPLEPYGLLKMSKGQPCTRFLCCWFVWFFRQGKDMVAYTLSLCRAEQFPSMNWHEYTALIIRHRQDRSSLFLCKRPLWMEMHLPSHRAHFRQHNENEVEHFSSSAMNNHCIIHHVGTIFLAQWRSRRRSAGERLEFLLACFSHHHDAVVEELYHDLAHRLRFTAFEQCS